MALFSKSVHGAVVAPRVQAHELAELHQLSGVTAFSAIGICVSLIMLNFTDAGEWLIAVANGF